MVSKVNDTQESTRNFSHTPEPWAVCGHWEQEKCGCGKHRGYIWGPDGNTVVAQMGADRVGDVQVFAEAGHEQMRADCHRIVACVNACAGVATEVLERFAAAGGIGRYQVRVRRLLEAAGDRVAMGHNLACEVTLKATNVCECGHDALGEAMEAIRGAPNE